MDPLRLRWPLVALLCVTFCAETFRSTGAGVSAEVVNGRYRFFAGTDPVALLLAATLFAAYVLLMCSTTNEGAGPLPSLFRRFAAFWVDFILVMFITAPLMGLLPVFIEWRGTNQFAWNFERTTRESSDMVVLVVTQLIGGVLLLCYYALPLTRRRPSPGACILGYQVLPDPGFSLSFPRAVLRTLVGFVAVSAAWLAPFAGRDRHAGKFWLDRVFHTHARILK